MPGDTRIVMIHVGVPKTEIPKEELKARLRNEAPYFMRTLVDMELPKRRGRLRLPVIDTTHKLGAETNSRDPLPEFMSTHVERVDGPYIPIAALQNAFLSTLLPQDFTAWEKRRLGRLLKSMGEPFFTGRYGDVRFVKNVAWRDDSPFASAV